MYFILNKRNNLRILMSYKFGNSSKQKLQKVHPDLVKVMNLAIEKSTKDFSIIEGIRTLQRQKQLLQEKKTTTLNSKHLIQPSGFGHAVDVAPYPVDWNLESFYPIAEAVRKAAKELKIKVRWGGAWCILNDTTKPIKELVQDYSAERRSQKRRVFIDAPHFEIV